MMDYTRRLYNRKTRLTPRLPGVPVSLSVNFPRLSMISFMLLPCGSTTHGGTDEVEVVLAER
jgi:hypothetical protein